MGGTASDQYGSLFPPPGPPQLNGFRLGNECPFHLRRAPACPPCIQCSHPHRRCNQALLYWGLTRASLTTHVPWFLTCTRPSGGGEWAGRSGQVRNGT